MAPVLISAQCVWLLNRWGGAGVGASGCSRPSCQCAWVQTFVNKSAKKSNLDFPTSKPTTSGALGLGPQWPLWVVAGGGGCSQGHAILQVSECLLLPSHPINMGHERNDIFLRLSVNVEGHQNTFCVHSVGGTWEPGVGWGLVAGACRWLCAAAPAACLLMRSGGKGGRACEGWE